MTATTVPAHPIQLPASPLGLARDTILLTGRSLRAIPRVPERLLDVTIQPIVFILLFLYVFGSAIHVPGVSYENYMFPGIIGQSLAFGIIGAGVATSNDMTEGVIDRFRSMPISRLSIISGQVMGQFCEQVLGMVTPSRERSPSGIRSPRSSAPCAGSPLPASTPAARGSSTTPSWRWPCGASS